AATRAVPGAASRGGSSSRQARRARSRSHDAARGAGGTGRVEEGPVRRPRFTAPLITLVLSGACLSPPADNPNIPVVAMTSGPAKLDPRIGTDDSSQKIGQLIFNDLMELGSDLRVGPGLAERLDSPDPTTYVATLRRGVKFHDGHELTSADVVYTFRS